MMDRWLFAMKVVNFRKKARMNWSRRCTRKACEAWKVLLKRKYLEQRLIDNRSIWQRFDYEEDIQEMATAEAKGRHRE
ncbi:hypothetical protein OS493_006434 [Desmophyllum pertusum]|uniref:Uncharacterized protein n=1 Tax=Desmophyllum pertusum TaxID=174260 RepID=A0A9X0A4W2_9CNID|nr:hypothetical protein OS493_006434 [Desmophyllum pertusum]